MDTSILSTFAPDRDPLPRRTAIWFRGQAERLFIPSIAVAEIERGTRKLARAGSVARVDRLIAWLDTLLETFGDRVLPVDVPTARRAGTIEDALNAQGRNPGFADILIAAVADVHNLTILTANVKHFQPMGLPYLDPFTELPD